MIGPAYESIPVPLVSRRCGVAVVRAGSKWESAKRRVGNDLRSERARGGGRCGWRWMEQRERERRGNESIRREFFSEPAPRISARHHAQFFVGGFGGEKVFDLHES